MASGRRAGQRFDAAHRITTEALTFLGELDPDAMGPNLDYATHYEATAIGEFDKLMAANVVAPAGATFVDVGSGMGRVVLLAARWPFKQVIGVEFSPALHEIAKQNLSSYTGALQCRDIRLVLADAADYEFPKGNLVVYLFNPFYAPVLRRVIGHLGEHQTGDVAVLYHTPVERSVIDDDARFECVADAGVGLVYRLRDRVT